MLPTRSFPFLQNQAKEWTSTFSDFLPNGKFTPGLPRLSDSPPAGSQVDIDVQIDSLSVIDLGNEDIFDCWQAFKNNIKINRHGIIWQI